MPFLFISFFVFRSFFRPLFSFLTSSSSAFTSSCLPSISFGFYFHLPPKLPVTSNYCTLVDEHGGLITLASSSATTPRHATFNMPID